MKGKKKDMACVEIPINYGIALTTKKLPGFTTKNEKGGGS